MYQVVSDQEILALLGASTWCIRQKVSSMGEIYRTMPTLSVSGQLSRNSTSNVHPRFINRPALSCPAILVAPQNTGQNILALGGEQ